MAEFIDDILGTKEEHSELNFTHLHVHTIYSMLDGYNFPKRLASRAKELGMKAIAMTDHNHLGGAIDFQAACKAEGIKPILGVEAYWTKDMNILSLPAEDRHELALKAAEEDGLTFPKKAKKSDIKSAIAPYEYNTKQYHIILLAINQNGWRNIVKIQSEAARRCTFNKRFCCDDELLARYSDDVIMTTACVGNVVPHYIMNGEYDKAEEQIDRWHEIFGDRFYLELQPLNTPEQRLTNYMYYQWSKEKDIKLVATTDTHYTLEEDWDDHDTLLCIGIGKKKEDTDRMRYENDFWVKSYDEMIRGFSIQALHIKYDMDDFNIEDYLDTVEEALQNTNLIADMIQEIKLGSDVNLFPRINVPHGFTPERYLILKCFRGLYGYYKKHPEIDIHAYEKRLNMELNIINKKGFAPYMLIVDEYVRWANEHGCPTGPGRGSAAGALCLFTLNITQMIDPIKYNLLFFRFLTEDRTSPPDIDTDFEYFGRDSVIHHLEDEYGRENVAHIGTYTVMGVKSGLKDVGRVLNIDFKIMNEISKKVDEWSDVPTLKFKHLDALKDSDRPYDVQAYEEFKAYEAEYPELFGLARKFEGAVRNMGCHASGVLITPMAIDDLFPTRVDDDGTIITLYTGSQLEELKAIKFDILGLKTLTVIKKTLEAINPELTFQDLYDSVDVDDPEIFEMIRAKETEGLFQIESNLFKGMVEDIQPDSLNDIIVINALGRPGPLKAGMPQAYAKRKRGEEEAVSPAL
jgi:DNA polymerase-3 subunit alpha